MPRISSSSGSPPLPPGWPSAPSGSRGHRRSSVLLRLVSRSCRCIGERQKRPLISGRYRAKTPQARRASGVGTASTSNSVIGQHQVGGLSDHRSRWLGGGGGASPPLAAPAHRAAWRRHWRPPTPPVGAGAPGHAAATRSGLTLPCTTCSGCTGFSSLEGGEKGSVKVAPGGATGRRPAWFAVEQKLS